MAATNGLVSYQNSSDDNDDNKEEEEEAEGEAKRRRRGAAEPSSAEPRQPTDVTDGRRSSEQNLADAPHGTVADATAIGPPLGPDAPTNGGPVVGETDSPAERPEKMTERETIRYLTQPPVPMPTMPPSPSGSPHPAANARFARFRELKAKGVHFNQDLAQKSSFLNRALLATMMARVGVDEEDQYNTSLPLETWCPKEFPEWAYKERLFESQQQIRDKDEAEKKALAAAGTRTIDFAPSGESPGELSRRATPSYQKRRGP